MIQYYAKRIIIGAIILFITSLIIYGLIRLMPSDYVQNTTAGNSSITAEMKVQMTKSYGLDLPFTSGYINWVSGLMKGDLGVSFLYKKPILEVIKSGAFVTLFISIIALIIQLGIALILGLNAGYHKTRVSTYLTDLLSIVSVSVPIFFLGLLLQKFLAIDAGIFPLQGQVSLKQDFVGVFGFFDFAWHMILPILTVAISSMGGTIKYIKASVEKISKTEYILAAKARGVSSNKIIWQEIFPNIKVLFVSIVFRELPLLLTGTLIIEQIFGLNGVGAMAFKALLMGDVPFIMGFAMLVAFLIVVFSIVEDVFYHLADPRIRIGGGAIK
jgi:peptide/nickel transport system permease protein